MYDNWIHNIIHSYLNNIVEENNKKHYVSRERQIAEELLNSLDEGLMQKIAAGVVGGALASGVGCGSNKNEPCPTPTPTVKAGAEGELFNKKTTPSAKSPTTKPKPTYKAKKGTGAEGEL